MKKVLLALVLMLLASPVFGLQSHRQLTTDTLSTADKNTGWSQVDTSELTRIAFFITANSTSTTNAVTTGRTLQASANVSDWVNVSWYDVAGGTTLQGEETFEGNGTYLMWLELDESAPTPDVRIQVYADAPEHWPADSVVITIHVVEEK